MGKGLLPVVTAGIVLSFLLPSERASAQQITIDNGRCGSGVHLVAKGARLSDVLKQLSKKLEFQLKFESNIDPVLNVDLTHPGPELVRKLSTTDSVLITQAIDPQCPRQYRISKVWVLPKSQGVAGATQSAPGVAIVGKAAPAPPAKQPPPPPAPAAQWTPSQLDEMSRQRKAAYDAYVKEHGKPPPAPPDDPAPN